MLTYLVGTDETLEVFQTPRVAEEVTAGIVAQLPWLAEIIEDMPWPNAPPYEFHDWHGITMGNYAMNQLFQLVPIDPRDHTLIDPNSEFMVMGGQSSKSS